MFRASLFLRQGFRRDIKSPEGRRDSLPLLTSLRAAWRMVSPYWRSREGVLGWVMLISILAMNAGLIYISKIFNDWQRDLWDSIEAFDFGAFKGLMVMWVWLSAIAIGVAVVNSLITSVLDLRWRAFLTERVTREWLADRIYYRMQVADRHTDNPDQRIQEDLASLSSSTVSLFVGTLSDLANLATFSVVLWGLSHSVSVTLLGHEVQLPDGYLLYLAVGYSLAATLITFWLGKPLVRLNFRQQRFEADFRYQLIRVRESAESIALYHGEREELKGLNAAFHAVVDNFLSLIHYTKRLGFFTFGYYQLAVIFPVVVSVPMYFQKVITMGIIMQILRAFDEVQTSLSTIINSFSSWASWKATVDRLALYFDAMEQAAGMECLTPGRSGKGVRVEGLSVSSPGGEGLASGLSLELPPGERLLIRGPSGCGKTTLLKAVAGIWPWAQGEVTFPGEGEVMFLSQRPYLPLGSLRAAACYPGAALPGDEVAGLFRELGLSHLLPHLDEEGNWSQRLSLGEQQRVAFVRALLRRPRVLFLDEATSALDVGAEGTAYGLLLRSLPDSIIVSVGHRSTLVRHHRLALEAARGGTWRLEPLREGS
ncbi:MAG: ABC transporter ATP-binding protein/permease [Succinivibrionaceae bacterium]|nr:ABC transporter ATP-binding protein/permease [Succinivibrionaceae bacterium]